MRYEVQCRHNTYDFGLFENKYVKLKDLVQLYKV